MNIFRQKILFVGDGFWGDTPGVPHLLSTRLVLDHPEVDFTFFYDYNSANSVEKVSQNKPRTIIGRDPNIVLLQLGHHEIQKNMDLNEFSSEMDQLLREIKDKTKALCILGDVALSVFAGNEAKQALAAQYNEALKVLAQNHGCVFMDYTPTLSSFHKIQQAREGTMYSLQNDLSQLTLTGQFLVQRKLYNFLTPHINEGFQNFLVCKKQ